MNSIDMKLEIKEKEALENIKKHNTKLIDLTKMRDDYLEETNQFLFHFTQDLDLDRATKYLALGIPCGADILYFKGKELSHAEEHLLDDDEIKEARRMYVPLKSIQHLHKFDSSHFCHYLVNPEYMHPKLVESFNYRFECLTYKSFDMFDENEIDRIIDEMVENIPLTYEKLEALKEKYITPERVDRFISRQRGMTYDRYYELIDPNNQITEDLGLTL